MARMGGDVGSIVRRDHFGMELLSVVLGNDWGRRGRVGLLGVRINVGGGARSHACSVMQGNACPSVGERVTVHSSIERQLRSPKRACRVAGVSVAGVTRRSPIGILRRGSVVGRAPEVSRRDREYLVALTATGMACMSCRRERGFPREGGDRRG
jgi:hypothetical protein